jgi:hypothetical protein
MKFTPIIEIPWLDSETDTEVVESSPDNMKHLTKISIDKPFSKVTPNTIDSKKSTSPSITASKEELINELLESAGEIYKQSGATARKLLYERVELGRVLIRLKNEVDYGDFLTTFKLWTEEGRIPFSLKTGQRSMAYAELADSGKFVDANKNDIVSNHADAERLRKAEAAEAKRPRKAEEVETKTGEGTSTVLNSTEGGEDDNYQSDAPMTLKESQIVPKAKSLVRPLIEECRSYDGKSKQVLLEELIELLTEELERCSN